MRPRTANQPWHLGALQCSSVLSMEFSALSTTDPHLQSFDEFLRTLNGVAKDASSHACIVYRKFQLTLRMTSIAVGYPVQYVDSHSTTNLTPRECRERQISYSAPTNVTFEYRNCDHAETRIQAAGNLPIMVLSNRWHHMIYTQILN